MESRQIDLLDHFHPSIINIDTQMGTCERGMGILSSFILARAHLEKASDLFT